MCKSNTLTKNVRIILRELTAVEYSEVLTVPAAMSAEQLDSLVNTRYDVVDGGQYLDDAEYWERGDCRHEPAEPDDIADGDVSIEGGLIRVAEYPVAQTDITPARDCGSQPAGASPALAQLQDVPTDVLTRALRERGLAVSVWGLEDVASLVQDDDETGDLDDDAQDRLALAFLKRIAADLEGSLGSHGNDYTATQWETLKASLLAACKASAATPTETL